MYNQVFNMSNHSGSMMLNQVLFLLKDEYDFFVNIDSKIKASFLSDVLTIGYDYDCNDGEILQDLGQELEFCYSCHEIDTEFEEEGDICKNCCNKI